MSRPNDTLLAAIGQLEQTLAGDPAGRERAWADRVHGALERAVAALRQHTTDADAPGGLFAEVDLTRPSLARQVGELRREHGELAERIVALQKALAPVREAFAAPARAAGATSLLPEPPPVAAVPDFAAIRARGEELVAALARHRDVENGLVVESVTTDLGAGD